MEQHGNEKATLTEVMEVEEKLRDAGIYHGFPLQPNGVGGLRVIGPDSSYEFMEAIVPHDPGERSNEAESRERVSLYPDMVNIAATSEINKVRRFYRLRHPWKGQYGTVIVLEGEKEHVSKIFMPEISPERMRVVWMIHTALMRLKASLAEAEETAQRRLRSLINDAQWQTYLMEGIFQEIGKSGVSYILRRGRPTLALREWKPLCALCLHPLAYYEQPWAGAMPPSDDVIAHLMMIRSDEHYFWRKANQIPIDDLASGI